MNIKSVWLLKNSRNNNKCILQVIGSVWKTLLWYNSREKLRIAVEIIINYIYLNILIECIRIPTEKKIKRQKIRARESKRASAYLLIKMDICLRNKMQL